MPRTPVTFDQPRLDTRVLAGVSVAGALDDYSGGIPMVYSPLCNRLEAGSGFGFSGGLAVDYLLSRSLSLSLHARYGSYPGTFERIQPVGAVETGAEDQSGYLVVRINSEIDYQVLGADLLLKWSFADLNASQNQLGLAIGPSVMYPIKGTMTQDHVLEVYDTHGEPLTRRDLIENQGKALREVELAGDVEIEDIRWQRYGLRTGLYMNLSVGAGVYVTPGLYADLPFSNFSDYRWGAISLYEFQVDLKIGL